MSMIIGSARADENYRYSGGKRGDQRQKSSYDTVGEVSLQNFYVHSKGWYILRPIKASHAKKIAKAMKDACNNKHFGYSQPDRLSVFNYKSTENGSIKNDVNCDCSSLVRKCILDGAGKDVGNFTTYDEASTLESSGLFEPRKSYTTGTTLYDGDVLVTKTKGHTVIVVSGNSRDENSGSTKKTEKATYTIGRKYTVLVGNLNMRTGPSTNNKIVTVLNKGDKLTCKQLKKVGNSTWLSNGAGWICCISNNGEVYVG